MSKPKTKDKDALIQEWVEKIKQESLPAFSESVQQLSSLASEDEADLEKLSKLIKRDAALSTKILRASGSVYRTRRGRINTISRAIVMLGVKEVKKICLTCSLIDGLTDGNPPQELINEMSMAFYSATQARLFAIVRGDPHSEEVFLSALMLNIGPLAIWKVAYGQMLEVADMVGKEQCSIEEAEERVFGFTLGELSRALAKEWKLEQFIPMSDDPSENEKKRHQEITLSTALARSLAFGWESKVVNGVITAMEQTIAASPDAIVAVLRDASRDMLEMAASFSIQPPIEPIEEVPEKLGQSTEIKTIQIPEPSEITAEAEKEEEEEFIPIEPNPAFQLESLRNLSSLMASQAKPTMYVLHTIGGMHRGVGLDRVLFAILNDSRTILTARLSVGPNNKAVKDQFAFDISPERKTLFPYVFEKNEPIWLKRIPSSQRNELMTEMITHRLDTNDFFIAPVVVSNKWVGIFYADMKPSGRELTADLFDSFSQFAMQATLAFQHFEFSKATGAVK